MQAYHVKIYIYPNHPQLQRIAEAVARQNKGEVVSLAGLVPRSKPKEVASPPAPPQG